MQGVKNALGKNSNKRVKGGVVILTADEIYRGFLTVTGGGLGAPPSVAIEK